MATFYCLYLTKNMKTNRVYVGQHKTKNINDGYIGSGKRLKWEIEKYGRSAFRSRVLKIFSTKEEINKAEKNLVESAKEKYGTRLMNLMEGGFGGWDYINTNKLKHREKRSIIGIIKERRGEEGVKEYGRRISEALSGKRKSIFHKNALSVSKKSYYDKNPAAAKMAGDAMKAAISGSRWYHNPETGKSLRLKEPLEGWILGRKKNDNTYTGSC